MDKPETTALVLFMEMANALRVLAKSVKHPHFDSALKNAVNETLYFMVYLNNTEVVPPLSASVNPLDLTADEQRLARDRHIDGTFRKIPAIKAYKDRTGVSLRDAKEAIERWQEQNVVTNESY